MTDRLVRLIRLIVIIQGKPGILIKELAERCETTERTIYRDLELLSAAGIPLSSQGYGRGYGFIANFALYPPQWTLEESFAFQMLPSILEHVQQLLPPGFMTAYEKIIAADRKEQSKHRDIIADIAAIIQMGIPSYRQGEGDLVGRYHLLPIIQATIQQQTIEATYYTLSRNQTSFRRIDPYVLVPREQRFYLVGFCHNVKSIRTFRISRFLEVNITDEIFRKIDFNIHEFMKHTWSIERGQDLIHFRVRFSKNVARYVKEEELFIKPVILDNPDGSINFEVTVNHDREFLAWINQYGPDAEILEPQSYRDQMMERLIRWQQLYQ
jgi:predicted DNA-binding transcriptional regulator YafY